MKFSNNIIKNDTIEIVSSEYINWEYFKNSTVLVTGATGLIGTQTVFALLYANSVLHLNINVLAAVRNMEKAGVIYKKYKKNKNLSFICNDITKEIRYKKQVDYIIHTANSTSSSEFVTRPVETINSIVEGTSKILEFARKSKVKGIVYLSSMEVYGYVPLSKNEPLREKDLGYIDISNVRSSYQEAKRTAELLCYSYAKEFGVPVKVARLAQTIGAGVDYNDNRVFAQFARNIVEKQDIVLKTKGESVRSYCYITDAVIAILAMLEKGEQGESYNIANPLTTCSIRDMAEMLTSKYTASKLRLEFDEKFYPTPSKYYLDTTKFEDAASWKARVSLSEAYSRLISSFYFKFAECKYTNYNLPLLKQLVANIQKSLYVKNDNTHKVFRFFGITLKVPLKLLYRKYSKDVPVNPNKILFNNFSGVGYGCNPKYIAEEILRRKLPYELVWLCKNSNILKSSDLPESMNRVLYSYRSAYEHFSSAKLIISNVHLNKAISWDWVKKDNQKYIQTWHGSLGIKKIDKSVRAKDNMFFNSKWRSLADIDCSITDYMISNSEFENNVYREGLAWNKDAILLGHPRNDVFFLSDREKQKVVDKVYDALSIPKNTKLVLYAPSFRDDKKIDCFNLDYKSLKNNLERIYGGQWTVMVRLHPNLDKKNILSEIYGENCEFVNATNYPDIQELLVAADVGITDYSSWIFDFMLSKKPAFIYAEDIDEFRECRGFYYPIESTPFPIAKNNQELVANISNFNYEQYKLSVDEFLKQKGCMEDGHAAERVVDLIEKIMSEK